MERDLEGIFFHQKRFFDAGKTRPLPWRLEQLRRLRRLVADNAAALKDALAAEIQTAWFDRAVEIERSLEAIDHAIANLDEWTHSRAPDPHARLLESQKQAATDHEPYGVSLIITANNAPLALFLQALIATICAGNTAIVTFDGPTPPLSPRFEALFPEYFDEATVAFLGDSDEGLLTTLLTLPFALIFFTGHADTGRIVVGATADHPTTVTLELNRHNPVIVDETADLDDAANRIVHATMAFGGQWCVAPTYVYVHESVADDFVEACIGAVETFFGDDPRHSAYLAPMHSVQDTDRLVTLFQGAPIILGGEGDGKSRYVAPTIVYPASWSDPIMQSDVRGPVLPILSYNSLHTALDIVGKRPESLAVYLFSRSDRTMRNFVDALSIKDGAVDPDVFCRFSPTADPFGGAGVSRMGRHSGRLGYDAFSRFQRDHGYD